MRRSRDLPILGPMTTPPRWLREHRRAVRAAASPESPAAEVAWRVEAERGPTRWKNTLINGDTFGERIPDVEWEPFIAAIEEVKGRPLAR